MRPRRTRRTRLKRRRRRRRTGCAEAKQRWATRGRAGCEGWLGWAGGVTSEPMDWRRLRSWSAERDSRSSLSAEMRPSTRARSAVRSSLRRQLLSSASTLLLFSSICSWWAFHRSFSTPARPFSSFEISSTVWFTLSKLCTSICEQCGPAELESDPTLVCAPLCAKSSTCTSGEIASEVIWSFSSFFSTSAICGVRRISAASSLLT